MKISNLLAVNQTRKSESKRIKSVDVFRGLTIAMMLFVGSPENPSSVNSRIGHASWNGLNLADYVFPFFIFICGISIPLSLRRRMERGEPKLKILLHIIYRSAAIFLMGLFLNGFPGFNLATIRIPGVLQRIAVVYLIAGIIVLESNIIVEAAAAVFILILYYIIMKCVNVPGFGAGVLQVNGNLAQYVDIKMLKGHMYSSTFDPEGILGTVSSISTVLFGVLCGELLISQKLGKLEWVKRVIILAGTGVIFMLAGNYISRWFPINKKLWSSSFVLYTSGAALLIIGVLYLILDVIKYTSAFTPLLILGSSPFFVYVGSELALETVWKINIEGPNKSIVTLGKWLRINIITPWAGKYDLYYFPIAYILLWILIVWIFRKNQYTKA